MIIRRTSFDAGALRRFPANHGSAADDDFRGRAERLLEEAKVVEDVTARTELIIKAAILHHLALLRETGREIAPAPLEELPSFASARLDAQMLGQDGLGRGLRGGEEVLARARQAYEAREPASEGSRPPGPLRKR